MNSTTTYTPGHTKIRAFRNSRIFLLFAIGLGICIGTGSYGLCSVLCLYEINSGQALIDMPAIDLGLTAAEIPDTPSIGMIKKPLDKNQPLLLKKPSLSGRQVPKFWPRMNDQELIGFLKKYPLFATAEYYLSPLYRHDGNKPYVIGHVRYGQEVRASQPVKAPGCSNGKWHQVVGDALVCSEDGFKITDRPYELVNRYTPPKIGLFEPFLYAKAKKGTPRFHFFPSVDQEKVLATKDTKSIKELGIVKEWLNGAYFVAIDKLIEQDDLSYYRTTMGYYLRKEDVDPLERILMHGEFLDSNKQLPLAFVYGQDRSLYCLDEAGTLKECGRTEKHARMHIDKIIEKADQKYAVGFGGYALVRSDVRLAQRIDRPKGIPENAKWIHIDLAEQALVAYENDKPVMATLVSSGLDTHATPTGTWKIERRYLTKTMAGPDPDHGVYEVAEVPWTMYYYNNYAVHGAYWHNVFGEQRSHGCTNIPPADARWLFRWIEPKLPRGWYTMFSQENSWIHFTN